MRYLVPGLTLLLITGFVVLGTARPTLGEANDPAVKPQAIEPTAPATPERAPQAEPASAVCAEPVEAVDGKSVKQWRAEGPEGLAKLIEQMEPSIEAYTKTKVHPQLANSKELQEQLAKAEADLRFIDQVAQQRDAFYAKLYWYTDLDEAKAQAKRSNKPILSLRMLGKLCDEYSCANSRFFRTALYTDAKVSELLREKFVLHWQSVRPVPVITVDMGDGRVIKRTITGNSAHYILDTHGRVVDCLPGLYGPGTFLRKVSGTHAMAVKYSELDDEKFVVNLRGMHTFQKMMLDEAWKQIASAAVRKAKDPAVKVPDANQAGMLAFGKSRVEAPLVNAVVPTPAKAADDQELWGRIAEAYAEEAKLGGASRVLMRLKTTTAEQAGRVTHGKRFVEDPLLRMVRNFENAIAVDTARNEHLLHREIHQWFIDAKTPLDLDKLNKRVYAQLFLTPDEDPWLGLVPADTYSALDDRGLVQ